MKKILMCAVLMVLGVSTVAQPYTKSDLKTARKIAAATAALPVVAGFLSNGQAQSEAADYAAGLSDHAYKVLASASEGGELIAKVVKVLKTLQDVAPGNEVFNKAWDKDSGMQLAVALVGFILVDTLKSAGGKAIVKQFNGDEKRITRRVLNVLVEQLVTSGVKGASVYGLDKYAHGKDAESFKLARETFVNELIKGLAFGAAYNIAGEVIAQGAEDDQAAGVASLQDLLALIRPNAQEQQEVPVLA